MKKKDIEVMNELLESVCLAVPYADWEISANKDLVKWHGYVPESMIVGCTLLGYALDFTNSRKINCDCWAGWEVRLESGYFAGDVDGYCIDDLVMLAKCVCSRLVQNNLTQDIMRMISEAPRYVVRGESDTLYERAAELRRALRQSPLLQDNISGAIIPGYADIMCLEKDKRDDLVRSLDDVKKKMNDVIGEERVTWDAERGDPTP